MPRAALRQAMNTDGSSDANADADAVADSVAAPNEPAADVETAEVPAAEEATSEGAAPEATAPEVAPKPRIRFSRGRRTGTDESVAADAASDPADSDPADSDPADSDPATSDDAADASDADVAGDEDGHDDAAPDADAPEPILVPHRTAGRSLKLALIAAAALFVAAAAFTGATLQPYLTDRALTQTKFTVAETAARAITTLWTYTPDDMANLPTRSAKYLGGDFASEYSKYIEAIAAPNKQAQITNNTQVLGAAIESLRGDEATAIVYTNSVATSPVTKGAPSLRYLSYRLAMKRQGSDWLITRMTALTSLDVTPRI
jgi:Mce-associated membrane protein